MHTVKLTLGALVTCLMLTGCLDVTTEDKEKTPQIKAFADTLITSFAVSAELLQTS